MKFVFRGIVIIAALIFSGCASMKESVRYAALAKEHSFAYFFTDVEFLRPFSCIEEAEEYINTATAKFAQEVSKKRAKGMGAKLQGPVVEDAPITVYCNFLAANQFGKRLEISELRNAVQAQLFFIVFHNNRIVSFSNYYLAENYVYDSNSNRKYFYITMPLTDDDTLGTAKFTNSELGGNKLTISETTGKPGLGKGDYYKINDPLRNSSRLNGKWYSSEEAAYNENVEAIVFEITNGILIVSDEAVARLTVSGDIITSTSIRKYEADYPVGWGIKKAFRYLKREID